MPPPHTTPVELDADLQARVQRLADARHQTADGLMREVVAHYVAQEEARAVLLHDVQAAWDGFVATGLHVTGDEAEAWMERLEAGEDVAPPECHD